MDASIIAALSGAPASAVLAYILVALLRDRRTERRDFLRSRAADRKMLRWLGDTIQRQSALLLTMAETLAPGRSAAIAEQLAALFPHAPAPAAVEREGDEHEESP